MQILSVHKNVFLYDEVTFNVALHNCVGESFRGGAGENVNANSNIQWVIQKCMKDIVQIHMI